MAYARDAIPPWEREWREWAKQGFAVDIGINYLGQHQPDGDYWRPLSTVRTLGGPSAPGLAAPRWRVAVFRRNQVLLFEDDGAPMRLDLIEFVKEGVQDENRMTFTAP